MIEWVVIGMVHQTQNKDKIERFFSKPRLNSQFCVLPHNEGYCRSSWDKVY